MTSDLRNAILDTQVEIGQLATLLKVLSRGLDHPAEDAVSAAATAANGIADRMDKLLAVQAAHAAGGVE